MRKLEVFISSVQSEFAKEREMLYRYLLTDPLLGLFFEPFIFENLPASEQSATSTYLEKVEKCDIYLGIFGKKYGFENDDGVSPTEIEFIRATEAKKTRLIFLTTHTENERHPKELALIKKAEQEVVRKIFTDINELKTAVYSSLVRFLEEKEYIRTGPFDATFHMDADISDIDPEKLVRFATIAKAKRGFPISPEAPAFDILTHLNLISKKRITNAALLLFGKSPQRFFISSEIKCVQFYGTDVVKPIPSYFIKEICFNLLIRLLIL
jgi:predicted HTH transcriptional regulator